MTDRFIFQYAVRRNIKVDLAKSGRCYKYFNLRDGDLKLRFVDLRNVCTANSLANATKALGVQEKYSVDKQFLPFPYYDRLERLYGHDLPEYGSPCFRKMNSEKRICTRAEYAGFRERLKTTNHLGILVDYLRADVTLTLLGLVEAVEVYRELFQIALLDSSSFTSSSLFYRESSIIQPYLRAQPGFSRLAGTGLYMALASLSGGLTARMTSRMEKGQRLYPEEGEKLCKNISIADFR